MRFLIIIGLLPALDGLLWWLSARLTRRRLFRWIIGLFLGAQLLCFLWIIFSRLLETNWGHSLPKFAAAAIFIWHLIGVPLALLVLIVALPALVVRAIVRFVHRLQEKNVEGLASPEGWSRRDFLGAAVALAPPLFTFSLTGIALHQLSNFRVRRFALSFPGLPPELDGMTIVQVSDMHVGRFTEGRILRKMTDAVNELHGDLVLLTGDLINDALADLPSGLDYVRQMDSRFGLYLIEGNHDLIESAHLFEQRVKASGVPFLLDQTTTVSVRGVPLQLFGLSWTRGYAGGRDPAISVAVHKLVEDRRTDAFPILLAHHPHAFDAAVELAIPLTLSGHTHGGQLMLNEQLGCGPALFRYWSGLYTRGASQMIVSNGVGNWFPLRINAPAEIIHLTLRKA